MIRVATDGLVTVATIDRPERRNAVDHATLVQLRGVIADAGSSGARAFVLNGAGGTFCAGADLTDVEATGFADELRGVLSALTELPAATFAAVDGPALGAGCQLAIACDLRVASTSAIFGIPAARLGLMVDQWTVRRLAQLAGGSVARAMLLAAEMMGAEAAHAIGFVHRIGGHEEAITWARAVADLAPLSVAGHKLALERLSATAEPDADVLAAMRLVWASDDAREGRQAFLEKRPAAFTGR